MADGELLRRLRIALAVQCAAREWRQRTVAAKIGVPATTLSNWLHGTHPPPIGFVDRLEVALGLRPGTLPRLDDDEPQEAA